MVAAPKPKDPESVRIWVAMHIANKAIERVLHLMPRVEEIIHNLNGAIVFSKLDLNAGYHQIELHPDSRYITTFWTHTGLKRYKRLNFWICSAAEVFSDDIILYGKTHEEYGGPKVQFLFSAPIFLFSSPLFLFSSPFFLFSSPLFLFSAPFVLFSSPLFLFSAPKHQLP